jgi:transmembrane sensor
MNSLHRPPDPAAEEQASLWAARLEGGSLTAADRDALDAWLNADAAHRPLLSRYCQFSADLEEQLLALVATGGVKLPPEPGTESGFESAPVVRRWNFKWIASTALAAAAVVAFAVWLARPASRVETVATAAAQRSAFTLADGTRVELNARTSLTADITRTERRVRLAGGEAFFTVSKDQSRPFIIETPAGSVRVTGTVFNVRTDTPADLEVTVVEGSVQVRPGEPAAARDTGPFALGAHDCLTATGGNVAQRVLDASELDAALAWRQGQVVFNRVSLHDALAHFARYHGRGIILSPAAEAQAKPLGGQFSIDDLEGFLTGLEGPFGVRVNHEPNGTIRVSLRSEP